MQYTTSYSFDSDCDDARPLQERMQELLTTEIGFVHEADFGACGPLDIENERPDHLYQKERTSRSKTPKRLPRTLDALVRYPLLTPEGERWLFRRYNYFKYRANAFRANLDPDVPDELTVAAIEHALRVAFETRSRLAESNLRLVVSIAARFADADCTVEELVSEGNVVLLRAIELFNVTKGYRFSTYATHSVQRHFYRLYKKRQRAKSREAVAMDLVASEATDATEESSRRDSLLAAAADLQRHWDGCLSPRERVILNRRYGLDTNERKSCQTLECIGRELGISKERVRQIQARAERKLREHFDLDQLQEA